MCVSKQAHMYLCMHVYKHVDTPEYSAMDTEWVSSYKLENLLGCLPCRRSGWTPAPWGCQMSGPVCQPAPARLPPHSLPLDSQSAFMVRQRLQQGRYLALKDQHSKSKCIGTCSKHFSNRKQMSRSNSVKSNMYICLQLVIPELGLSMCTSGDAATTQCGLYRKAEKTMMMLHSTNGHAFHQRNACCVLCCVSLSNGKQC